MEHNLLPYETICKAVLGETESVCAVIDHFDGYINKLSLRWVADTSGGLRSWLHEDLKRELIVELIVKLPLFNCEQ